MKSPPSQVWFIKNNVDKRYSKRINDRSDWDDVSDSSDKIYRRFKRIKPKRLEYTEGKNKNNLHYEVSGRVMLTKSYRKRNIYQNGGDSDQSKSKNKFIRNKSKDSKVRLPDTKSTLYWMDTTN